MIFIVGSSRSGTTMLGRILGLNSQIKTFGELHFFEQLVDTAEFEKNPMWSPEKAQLLIEQLLTRSREGFFAVFRPGHYEADARDIVKQSSDIRPVELYSAFMFHEATRAGRRRPCEQTPRYLFSSREILRAYPDARIINMIRDPRDVVLSQRSKWRRRFLGGASIPLVEAIRAWCNYHPWLVSRLWASCVGYARTIEGDRFISVRFEDLVVAPDSEIRKICEFLNIEFEGDMLNTLQVGSSAASDAVGKKGINSGRAQAWKDSGMSVRNRLLCEWVCGAEMDRLGYSDLLSNGRFSFSVVPSLFILPIKIILAMCFNMNRYKRTFSSLKRRFFGEIGVI